MLFERGKISNYFISVLRIIANTSCRARLKPLAGLVGLLMPRIERGMIVTFN